eukprot:CAMPEP_0194041306 /NCGR_PEP_ID=MMETSP0009_2-20130614/13223_1 /TAXON_ID=210454 /ORGANISM="Grammatophora oceanica, Strain CCMP 410" /LENGTH=81 /DNA_ID=CAMNT_0038684757 /DNA_START=21 /DNA_END=262 /DNA_ORIENTATION=+
MKAFPSQEDLQSWGCMALGVFASGNSNNNKIIASQGGIELVLNAMKEVSSDIELQTYGCMALGEFASGNSNNNKIIASQGG